MKTRFSKVSRLNADNEYELRRREELSYVKILVGR
jgi:hypothetical protein